MHFILTFLFFAPKENSEYWNLYKNNLCAKMENLHAEMMNRLNILTAFSRLYV